MTKRIKCSLALGLIIGVLFTTVPRAGAQATEKSAPEKKVTEEKGRNSTYRVDIKVSEFESEKKLNSRAYSLLLEPSDRKELRVGTRVPVSTGGVGEKQQFQYMDVGQSIDCVLRSETEHTVDLTLWVEMSNFSFRELPSGENAQESSHGNPIIKQIKLQTSAALELGKPTIVSTLDDPSSKRVFQIEATATRVSEKQ